MPLIPPLLPFLSLAGAPTSVESSTVPRHKKCEAAGTKQLLKLDRVWLEQVDAQELKEGVEFTLMDWGNIRIKVSQSASQPARFCLQRLLRKDVCNCIMCLLDTVPACWSNLVT